MKVKKICKILVCVSLLCFTIVLVIVFMNNGDLLPFKDVDFSRDISGCRENLVFSDEIHYYEPCGNPVGSYDLCNTYSYSERKQRIVVNCDNFKKEFKILNYSDSGVLVLENDGETKIFYEDGSIYDRMFENGDEFIFGGKLTSTDKTCLETITFRDDFIETSSRCKNSWLNNKMCYSYIYDYSDNKIQVGCYDYDKGFDVYDVDIELTDDMLLNFKIDGKTYTYKSGLVLSDFDVVGNYSSKYVTDKVTITEDEFILTSGIYRYTYEYKLYENGSRKMIHVFDDFGYSRWYDFGEGSSDEIRDVYVKNRRFYKVKLDLYEEKN